MRNLEALLGLILEINALSTLLGFKFLGLIGAYIIGDVGRTLNLGQFRPLNSIFIHYWGLFSEKRPLNINYFVDQQQQQQEKHQNIG